MTRRSLAASLAIFLAGATLTSLFAINLCGTVFQCGCQSLWAGAAAHCNIHSHGVKHCPWCDIGEMAQLGVYGSMIASQALLSFRPRRWTWPVRLAAVALAFPLVGTIEALVLGWHKQYWV